MYDIDQPAAAQFNLTGAPLSFSIRTSDLPKFGFPKTIKGNIANGARVEEEFVTCLVIASGEKRYFLHEFNWVYTASWSRTGPNPAPMSNGIRVIRERAIEAPYAQPVTINLTGLPANRAEKMRFT